MDVDRLCFRDRASRITVVAHVCGVTALILMLLWLLHYRGGFDLYDSQNPSRILNVHPFLMFFGFILFAGEAMMVYKTVTTNREIQKVVHMAMHIIAMILGIIGIYAAFKYHSKRNITNMYSLHSWIGLSTFILYSIQWFFGFVTFWFPSTISTRELYKPWHANFGRALLYMAIITAETGLMELFTILGLVNNNEARLINFTGLAILLFGIAVDISVCCARYV